MNLPLAMFRTATALLPRPAAMRLVMAGQRALNLWRYGDSTFPRSFAIEVTTHCNRACSYCPQSVEPTGIRHIAPEVYNAILDRLAEIRWRGTVYFHFYNEPLLDITLEAKVRQLLIKVPGCIPSVVSNGDALTQKRAQSLIEAGVRQISITEHPPYYPHWRAMIQPIAKRWPHIVVVHNIAGTALSNRGGLVNPDFTEANEFNVRGCRHPSYCQQISIDGDYIWCCCDYRKTNLLGNVRDCSILAAWNKPKWRALRSFVANRHPILPVCKACFEITRPPTDAKPERLFVKS